MRGRDEHEHVSWCHRHVRMSQLCIYLKGYDIPYDVAVLISLNRGTCQEESGS